MDRFNVTAQDRSRWTSSNASNASTADLVLTSVEQTELLTWVIFTAIISFVGAFNNILVLLVTWPRNRGTSGLNLLIFHFVSVNLFMCFINIPVSVLMVEGHRAGYVVPSSICNYIQAIYNIVSGVTNWADASLAINRCIALFFPHNYRMWSTKYVNLSLMTFAWIVSSVAVLPMSFGIGGSMNLLPLGECAHQPYGFLGRCLTGLVVLAPFSVAGGGSALILWKSYKISRNRVAAISSDGNRRVVLRRLRMMLFTFLWTVICNVPSGVLILNLPSLFVRVPTTVLWLRTCSSTQYGFTPVSLLFRNLALRSNRHQLIFDNL
jgi:hypothetical protein